MSGYYMFESDRLWIRPTTEEDAAFILEVFTSDKALRFIGDRNIRTEADARTFIRNRPLTQLKHCGFSNYTLVEKERGVKVGVAGLYARPTLDLVDLGYALLPKYEGNGFAREASRVLMDVARSHFEMEQLCAITHPDNKASTRLLESLGFEYIRRLDLEGVDGESLYFEADI